jgi:hypothetical protein
MQCSIYGLSRLYFATKDAELITGRRHVEVVRRAWELGFLREGETVPCCTDGGWQAHFDEFRDLTLDGARLL